MRILSYILVFTLVFCVSAKSHTKSLTESMGQEVIEIGAPMKELPPDLEEEPAGEHEDNDDDDDQTTSTLQSVTKRDSKKLTPLLTNPRQRGKDIDKIDQVQEAEEARIEKELSEIYRDTNDYKGDETSEVAANRTTLANETEQKEALRQSYKHNSFQFQPDLNNKKEVDRFRTSIDEISCVRPVTKQFLKNDVNDGKKKQGTTSRNSGKNAAFRITMNIIFSIVSLLTLCC